MKRRPWHYLLWVVAAGALGFVMAAVFAGLLRLPQALFLVPYAVLSGSYLYGYIT